MHCHEDTLGSRGIAPSFLTSALDGSEWSASRPCRFTPEEEASGTHWIGGSVGPRFGLDAVEMRKSCNVRSQTRTVQPVAIPILMEAVCTFEKSVNRREITWW
jgi:hypothetical protein